MGELTRAEYRTFVRKALGNLSASDPVISDGQDITAINNAPNLLLRYYPDLFQEHQARTWTHGPLVAGENRVTSAYVPANLYTLDKVTRNESVTDPSDWSTVNEIPVTIPSGNAVHVLGLQDRDATGYPTLICRKDSDLLYWPVTDADSVCWLRLYGASRELPLTAEDHRFRMDRDFDTIIVKVAAQEIASLTPGMGWRVAELNEAISRELGRPFPADRRGVMTREMTRRKISIGIAGIP